MDQRALPLSPWKGENPRPSDVDMLREALIDSLSDQIKQRVDEDVLREFNLTSTPPR